MLNKHKRWFHSSRYISHTPLCVWEARSRPECQGPGRWSWLAEGRTSWSERKRWGRRSEWRCRSNQRDTQQRAWDMRWDEWVRTQTWAMQVHMIHCGNWTVWGVVFTLCPEACPALSFPLSLCFEMSSLHWLRITKLVGPAFAIARGCILSSFRHDTNRKTLSRLRDKVLKMAARVCRKIHNLEQTQKVIPFIFRDSFFTWIFLCSFRHHFRTLQNWTGQCSTNTKDDSIHHVWNFSLSACLRVGFWCQCVCFGSWCPKWCYRTTNQEQLCGFWKHVSLPGFFPLWSSWSLLRCLRTHTKFLARRIDLWGNKINIVQIIDHSMRLLSFLNCVRCWIPAIKCGYTIKPQPCIQRKDFWFCWTVRDWSLFLTHPTDWNKCMTSKNAQCSTRSRFWVFKISCKIGVLKQSRPALFGSVSHMAILFILTRMMNVRDQTT